MQSFTVHIAASPCPLVPRGGVTTFDATAGAARTYADIAEPAVRAYAKESLKQGGACGGKVDASFLRSALRASTVVGIAARASTGVTRSHARTVDVVGAFCAHFDDEGLYLDAICSANGAGQAMMRGMMQWAADSGVRVITLSALTHVISYYHRFGFALRDSCAEAPLEVPADVAEELRSGRWASSTKAPTIKFMRELQESGLNVKKTEGCEDVRFYNDVRKRECDADGYTMKACAL